MCDDQAGQYHGGGVPLQTGATQSRALLAKVKPILDWAEHLEALTATYIPGVTHALAKFLSRHLIHSNKWELHPQMFRLLTAKTFLPEVNLFATACNSKLIRFSQVNCREMEGINVLSSEWRFKAGYVFPPGPLIYRFLVRLHLELVLVLAIIPDWLAGHGICCYYD